MIIRREEHKPRSGLASYRLETGKGRESVICEEVQSSHPIVGFTQHGKAIFEGDDLLEAVSVPDVAIIRIRESLLVNGFRFIRVKFKAYKAI